jgi:hypothetical protein
MNRALTLALDTYRRAGLLWLRLRGETPESHAAARVASGQSWADFCDALKAAGAAVSGPGAPRDALTQAEGYRYLSRLARGGLEAFLEYADPQAPVLRRMAHETVKLGADNPDNHYYNAPLAGGAAYRITGQRGTVHFLSISTHRGGYGQSGGLQTVASVDSKDLDVAPDGTLVVDLGGAPRPRNWLPVPDDATMVMVRQTFRDRATERPAELGIARVDGDNVPGPLTAEALDRGLGQASAFVAGASLFFARWAAGFQRHVNALPRFDPATSTAAGGDPDIAYYHSYWRLGPDEALIIEVTPPRCQHWNFQLGNHWMESLDYRYHRIHVNGHTATYAPDGSVRIVVAHQDPGVPNWITTAGHAGGTMLLRWIHAESHPTPITRVVKLREVL